MANKPRKYEIRKKLCEFKKDTLDTVDMLAEMTGKSANAFINEAVEEKLQKIEDDAK